MEAGAALKAKTVVTFNALDLLLLLVAVLPW